jgi:hypothetical protein
MRHQAVVLRGEPVPQSDTNSDPREYLVAILPVHLVLHGLETRKPEKSRRDLYDLLYSHETKHCSLLACGKVPSRPAVAVADTAPFAIAVVPYATQRRKRRTTDVQPNRNIKLIGFTRMQLVDSFTIYSEHAVQPGHELRNKVDSQPRDICRIRPAP